MGFLIAIFYSAQFCARSWSIFRVPKSLSMTGEVYPFFVTPQQLHRSLHFFTTLLWLLWTSLYKAKPSQSASSNAVPNAIKSKQSFSSEEGFLSFKVTLHIHLIILMSLHSNLNKSASLTLLPIRHDTSNTCLVCTPYPSSKGRNSYKSGQVGNPKLFPFWSCSGNYTLFRTTTSTNYVALVAELINNL